MTPTDIARLTVYGSMILPSLAFVAIYLWLLPSLRARTESYHILAFTFVVGYVAVDFLMGITLGWWEFSLIRFLIVLGLMSLLLWQRAYLLIRYNVVPRVRKRRAKKKAAQQVD